MMFDQHLSPNEYVFSHARAFHRHHDFRLVGAVDPDSSHREQFANTYQVPAYSCVEDLLAQVAPDIAVVASPTTTHGATIDRILAHCRPQAILCEKPLANDLATAQAIVATCRAHRVPLFVNFVRRADPGRVEFSSLIGEKVILKPFAEGDITSEYVSWLNDPEVAKYSNQRFRKHTVASCANYLAGFAGTDNLFIKIERKSDGLFVGTMTAYVSRPHGTVDIGIMVGRRSVWGSGIGQDAWNMLIGWFLRQDAIRKVTAGTMRANGAMRKLMERSDMVLEAERPKQELLDGVPHDLLYYGKFSDA